MTLRKKSASRKSAHSRRRKSTKRSHRTKRLKSKSKNIKSARKSKSLRHGYHRMLRGGGQLPEADWKRVKGIKMGLPQLTGEDLKQTFKDRLSNALPKYSWTDAIIDKFLADTTSIETEDIELALQSTVVTGAGATGAGAAAGPRAAAAAEARAPTGAASTTTTQAQASTTQVQASTTQAHAQAHAQPQAQAAPTATAEVQQSLTHILTTLNDKPAFEKFTAIQALFTSNKFSRKQTKGVMLILNELGGDYEDKSKRIIQSLINNNKNSNEKLLAALGVGVGGSALAYMLGQSHGEKKDAKSKKQQKSPRTHTSQQSVNWRANLKYAD